MDLLRNTLALYLDAAPWLLLGLIAAGLIKAWVPEASMHRWLGGRGIWPVIKAALIGAPLPLCSCGVVPAAVGLRRAGASREATVSFLVATPETGADSIAVSYVLLGPFMAVVRPVAAVGSAIVAGLLTRLVRQEPTPFRVPLAPQACGCAGDCQSATLPPAGPPVWWQRGLGGLHYALTDLVDDIGWWFGAGLLAAGAVATLFSPLALAAVGSGVPAMLLVMAAGIPMYICATASTPVAAAMLLAGISPGTVLVFLLAGPATNLGTLGILRKELGSQVLGAYLAGIAITSLALGLATDWLARHLALDMHAQVAAVAHVVPYPVAVASGLLLAALLLRPLRRRFFP